MRNPNLAVVLELVLIFGPALLYLFFAWPL